MSIKTKATKFQPNFNRSNDKGEVVDARFVVLTEKNWTRVHEWSGGHLTVKVDKYGDESNPRIRLHTPHGIRVAQVGYSIVKVGRGPAASFYVVDHEIKTS